MKYCIYALIDPKTSTPFYVGATKNSLKIRLSQHIHSSKKRSKLIYSVGNKKADKIIEIISSGAYPIIKCLEAVELSILDQTEEKYYNLYKQMGFNLLQRDNSFRLSRHYEVKDGAIRIMATIRNITAESVRQIAKSENRKMSRMTGILLSEALMRRKTCHAEPLNS